MAGRQGGYSPDYPADVRQGAGIRVEKSGLTLKVGLDYGNVPTITDPLNAGFVLVQNPVTKLFARLDLGALPTTAPADGSVTNAKLAPAGPTSLKGNATATPAQPSDLSPSTVRALLGTGAAGGLASLDGTGTVPSAQLPPPGDTGTAGTVVGGQKALAAAGGSLIHASADNAAHFGRVAGISANAALSGAPVRYVSSGSIADPSFSFVEGPVYVGLSGALTQTYPTAGGGFVFRQQIGIAASSTRLIVQIAPPTRLV